MPSTAMWVGAAGPNDIPVIEELLHQHGLSLDGLATCIPSCLLGRDGDRVVGIAALEVYGPAAVLKAVLVDAEYRCRGLGRQLTAAALDLAWQHRVRTIYVAPRDAAEFFRSFGFTQIHQQQVESAVRQAASIADTPDTCILHYRVDHHLRTQSLGRITK